MSKVIDYYLTLASPWTYLGHARLVAMAAKAGAQINVKPVDYGKIFPASGGLPLAKRAPQRQAYRLMELQRWRSFLNQPLNLQPAFFPVAGDPSALFTLAACQLSASKGLQLTATILRGVWADEKNIADAATLVAMANACDLDGQAVQALAATPEIAARYAALTEEALALNVFGAPTYVFQGELYWGQDRLDFLERALAA